MPQSNATVDKATVRVVKSYIGVSVLVLVLMMVFGLLMLLSQGKIIELKPDIFYQIMTIHGTFMVGVASLAATAIMWYFLSQYVPLNVKVLKANLFFFILGVIFVLVGVFAFRFAGAWTFLYPLPAVSAGMWGKAGAIMYLAGMMLIGIGFLMIYFEAARAIIGKYGSLMNGLGWQVILGKVKGYGPPGAVVASTMVIIANTTGIVVGAIVIMMTIINLLNPSIQIDPLLAKNLIYAFGHIFANAVIYAGVIGVYEVLPRYTNRPWKSNKVFLIAWNFSTLFTILIYPHHMFMDFAMPAWLLGLGEAMSYGNGFPVLVVTAYGALMLVYRSGIKWDMASGFMFLSMFGWVAGVVPALVDATIAMNRVLHNTKWVPGHFHMYMGIGVISMILGFMYYLNKVEFGQKDVAFDKIMGYVFGIFFFGMTMTFLWAGDISVPRRWAVHLPEWIITDRWGALCASLVILATLYIFLRFVKAAWNKTTTNA